MDTSLAEASWCFTRYMIYMAPNNNMYMAKRCLITVLKFLGKRYKELNIQSPDCALPFFSD